MTTPTRSGIPTTYRGTNFRSRLEARWAAMFDLVGWSWTYEPLDADGYIPDFLIAGARPFFVEVGPCITEREYIDKARKPASLIERPTLVLGVSPLFERLPHYSAGGWFVNEFPEVRSEGPAFWLDCMNDDGDLTVSIFGDGDSAWPCGHRHRAETRERHLRDIWAEAGNNVQWRRTA